ncbi:MAG TPA: hypothetical protein P5526_29875 [Anaerolineae bacterium]|nr:hypothetical protein [Anaerolineae bacterium]MCB0176726.1 hypothetical protein [Anaerolineae bacterium]MCB0225508.1 hypothetical protein [Anaerolineae bacterium]MCB9103112.1 hypothetical protein [Anaerolineales bacterium]HRV96400.1 hypothetical protein [Anaerolineae bacterium]
MESINIDAETLAYIKSESEFSQARLKGFLEIIMGLITGHNMHLLSFDEIVEKLRLTQTIYKGLQDIPLDHIAGSTGRYEDFTRHFLPRTGDRRDKERWRNVYTLAVTGKGFPPIDVYKVDQVYFVKDGNHRVSVARKLEWPTIQAYVTELPSSISLEPDVAPRDLLIKEECAYFLEKTNLDQTRPDSKHHIDFTEPGGYRNLLNHIELHRNMLSLLATAPAQVKSRISLSDAAADWYDHVYLPITAAVRNLGVIKQFPNRSETDLYIWLIQHQAELREQHDLDKLLQSEIVQEFLDYLCREE